MTIRFKLACLIVLSCLCSEIIFALPFIHESINPCGDESWVPYKTEKCFKLLDHSLVTAADGSSLCSEMSSSLLTIDSAEEQAFISTYAFVTRRVVDNVWLAAHRIPQTDKFRWDADHSLVHLDFWAPSTPSSNQWRECLQMTLRYMQHFPQDTDDGLWMDTSCHRRNLVICQKQFRLTQEALQKIEIQKYNSTQLNEQMDKMGVLPVQKGKDDEITQLVFKIQRDRITELNSKLLEANQMMQHQQKFNEVIQTAFVIQGQNVTELKEEIRLEKELNEIITRELNHHKIIEAREKIWGEQEFEMEQVLEIQQYLMVFGIMILFTVILLAYIISSSQGLFVNSVTHEGKKTLPFDLRYKMADYKKMKLWKNYNYS